MLVNIKLILRVMIFILAAIIYECLPYAKVLHTLQILSTKVYEVAVSLFMKRKWNLEAMCQGGTANKKFKLKFESLCC
jgi:hypothetical protein